MPAPRPTRLARALALVAALVAVGAAPVAAQQQPPPAAAAPDTADADADSLPPDRPRRPRPPRPLFADSAVLALTLVADFRALGGDRDTLRPRLRPARLVLSPTGATPAAGDTLAVQLSARGHFRLRRDVCAFPPLRLVLDSAARRAARGTPFAGQRALKLVTHCRDAYERQPPREYLAYRAQALLGLPGLRARLVRARYVDAGDPSRARERWAVLLESERELADRMGGRVLTARNGRWDELGGDQGLSLALFAYFLGNTDWSLAYLHNVRLVATDTGVLPIGYDYDFSGLVDAPYATPDPRLGIARVRDRIWRGPCATPEALTAALRPYVERRDALRALWAAPAAPLEGGDAARALRFVDEFYERTGDVRRFAREVAAACVPGN